MITATSEPRGHYCITKSLVYPRRFQKGFKMNAKELEISLDSVRGQVCTVSRMLPVGSKYYTIDAKDIDLQFEKKRAAILANPGSPDLILNRSPRAIVLRDHSVLSQTFKTDINGNRIVVFNPDTEEEAQAAIVAGDFNFGQATDEAVKDALLGQQRIFANGVKLATKVNSINRIELDRVNAMIESLMRIKDSLTSTIASNSKKIQDYEKQLEAAKVPVDVNESGSVTVIV